MKVLIVDDEEIIRTIAGKILKKTGAEVIFAESGDEGIKHLQQSPDAINLVLLDYSMPGLSGTEALIKMREICPTIPCIFSSGNPMSADSLPEDLCANTFYLEKPYRAPHLTALVEKIMAASATK